MTSKLPIVGVNHGQRFLPSLVDEKAQVHPNDHWVAIPLDESDLSKGFTHVTYFQLAKAVNRAAYWLQQSLPSSNVEFQSFAYAGPRDLRYPILALAAGKIQKVMILLSTINTPEAQRRILLQKGCKIYMRPNSMASSIDHVVENELDIGTIGCPDLEDLMSESPVKPINLLGSWQTGKDYPWLVFHTSGTTGFPRPITYTHQMMASVDIAAGLQDIEETHIHQYAFQRWYTPLPSLHFVGMLMVTSMAMYVNTVIVLGPTSPPTPSKIRDIIKYGNVDGALLPPALIDTLCIDPEGLAALRGLQYIHYCGAPLGVESAKLLTPHVRVAPSIGSTEAGGYFVKLGKNPESWEWISFQPHAGAHFEQRLDNLYELVFVKQPQCAMQQVFRVHKNKSRFETSDLWIEHPKQKGFWKIVGRADDYVSLSHSGGLHASTLEPEIERHDLVKAALIGGHGRPRPVLLVELVDGEESIAEDRKDRERLLESFEPYLNNVNAKCHPEVHLSRDLVLFTKANKPFVRTAKGSVARMQSLNLYENEISELFPRK